MKKIFITPVAQIVATEVEAILATSTIGKQQGTAGDAGEARSMSGANGTSGVTSQPAINVEALDF